MQLCSRSRPNHASKILSQIKLKKTSFWRKKVVTILVSKFFFSIPFLDFVSIRLPVALGFQDRFNSRNQSRLMSANFGLEHPDSDTSRHLPLFCCRPSRRASPRCKQWHLSPLPRHEPPSPPPTVHVPEECRVMRKVQKKRKKIAWVSKVLMSLSAATPMSQKVLKSPLRDFQNSLINVHDKSVTLCLKWDFEDYIWDGRVGAQKITTATKTTIIYKIKCGDKRKKSLSLSFSHSPRVVVSLSHSANVPARAIIPPLLALPAKKRHISKYTPLQHTHTDTRWQEMFLLPHHFGSRQSARLQCQNFPLSNSTLRELITLSKKKELSVDGKPFPMPCTVPFQHLANCLLSIHLYTLYSCAEMYEQCRCKLVKAA